jgi:ubiquinone/menaquinone biosynthesis C-methylase UbiE
MRIKPGTPIPVPDNTYDFINLSHAIDFNEREDWPWLFDEFKRVLKKDGVMVITEGVTFSKPIAPWLKPEELFRYWTKEHFESFLKPAFPEKGNFHYRLHVDSEDGEYQRITIVIYGLNRGE